MTTLSTSVKEEIQHKKPKVKKCVLENKCGSNDKYCIIMQLKLEDIMTNSAALVDSCIRDKDLSKLLTLPDVCDDFPEVCIVRCLECFLKATDKEIEKAVKLSKAALLKKLPWAKDGIVTPFSIPKCYALNKMLQQKFSPQFLQEAARMISFDCVLELTRYFHFLLSCPITTEPQLEHTVPSFEQMIDWLNAILDSHYRQLLIAEDSMPIVNSLQERVNLMSDFQVESKEMQGKLQELFKQFEVQQKSAKDKQYCIEVISF